MLTAACHLIRNEKNHAHIVRTILFCTYNPICGAHSFICIISKVKKITNKMFSLQIVICLTLVFVGVSNGFVFSVASGFARGSKQRQMSLNRVARYCSSEDANSMNDQFCTGKSTNDHIYNYLVKLKERNMELEKNFAQLEKKRAQLEETHAQLEKRCTQLEKTYAQLEMNNKSFEDVRKLREAEAYDMRLLGNLQRLFIYEVVNPIMTMSWEIAQDVPDQPAEERSYFTYLGFIELYSSWLVCQQNPNYYNQLLFEYGYDLPTEYNALERIERVDRALYPVTGVKVLDVAFARDAFRRNTMKHWERMYTDDNKDSVDRFLTECEQCEWREEWRDLGSKMTRAVRSKLASDKILSEEGYYRLEDSEYY